MMAGRKVIQPEGQKGKRERCIARLFHIVDGTYVVLLFAGILISGIFQHDATIVGWTLIALGGFSALAAVFHLCMSAKGYHAPLRVPDLPQSKSKARFEDNVATAVLIFFAVLFLILGVLKLTILQ